MINARFYDLATQTPQAMSDAGMQYNTHDYIPFGQDNLFPQALALFTRTSPNHRGILNSKQGYIMGDGITSPDEQFAEELTSVNIKGETLTDVVRKLLIDDTRFGNVWLELISDRNRSFVWLNHLDSTKCRLAKNKEEVIVHPDWRMYKGKTDKYRRVLPLYPQWVQDEGDDEYRAWRTVIHLKDYEPEFVYYGLPDYIAAKSSIEIDLRTNKWNLARLKNSFRISGMLVVPVKDKAESKEVLDYIEKNYVGEDNQGKLLTITKSRASETEKADQTQLIETRQDDDGSWTDLHRQSTSDMIVTHRWFRSLSGQADNTGFDTQRILNEYEIALNTTIREYQEKYKRLLSKVYRDVVGRDVEFTFQNRPPFDTDDAKYVWEVRKEKGLDYNENDPKQQLLIYGQKVLGIKQEGGANG